MPARTVSHLVVGAGGLGAAAAYWLARGGSRDVLVLERHHLGHGLGASEDHSRIIRHAYHSSAYTALTPAAYATWDEIEAETGLELVRRTGGLDLAVAGTPAAAEVDERRRVLAEAGIPYEDLDGAELRRRYPQWRVGDDVTAMFQADGGILDIRKATAAHVALARGLGARFVCETPVRRLASRDSHVRVETDDAAYEAERVVLCAGAWLPELLPSLGLSWPITLSQEQVTYFATPNLRAFAPDRFPVWIWRGESVFYGFPVHGEVAVKAARDMAGRFVRLEERTHEPDPGEVERVGAFLRERLPGAVGPELSSRTCLYDMPPDRDFVLDVVPGHPRVVVGVGAGHAAKFASLLGRILSDLALHGATEHPIEPFAADRPALAGAPARAGAFRLAGRG